MKAQVQQLKNLKFIQFIDFAFFSNPRERCEMRKVESISILLLKFDYSETQSQIKIKKRFVLYASEKSSNHRIQNIR